MSQVLGTRTMVALNGGHPAMCRTWNSGTANRLVCGRLRWDVPAASTGCWRRVPVQRNGGRTIGRAAAVVQGNILGPTSGARGPVPDCGAVLEPEVAFRQGDPVALLLLPKKRERVASAAGIPSGSWPLRAAAASRRASLTFSRNSHHEHQLNAGSLAGVRSRAGVQRVGGHNRTLSEWRRTPGRTGACSGEDPNRARCQGDQMAGSRSVRTSTRGTSVGRLKMTRAPRARTAPFRKGDVVAAG
jgi:hypothetical protein